jgi:hypothetical protein
MSTTTRGPIKVPSASKLRRIAVDVLQALAKCEGDVPDAGTLADSICAPIASASTSSTVGICGARTVHCSKAIRKSGIQMMRVGSR